MFVSSAQPLSFLFRGLHPHRSGARKFQKFLECARDQCVVAIDENGSDARLSSGDLVNSNTAIAPNRSDQIFGQQSYAQARTYRAVYGF